MQTSMAKPHSYLHTVSNTDYYTLQALATLLTPIMTLVCMAYAIILTVAVTKNIRAMAHTQTPAMPPRDGGIRYHLGHDKSQLTISCVA